MKNKHYRSREFCKSIKCEVQGILEGKLDKGISEVVRESVKKHNCHENCKAYEFHQWLKDNDYNIVKKV